MVPSSRRGKNLQLDARRKNWAARKGKRSSEGKAAGVSDVQHNVGRQLLDHEPKQEMPAKNEERPGRRDRQKFGGRARAPRESKVPNNSGSSLL